MSCFVPWSLRRQGSKRRCAQITWRWARQGHSGFAWSWLGAALQATSLPFGVVNAPGQRYHPVIVAQAIATLAEMFPGRFWAALGSGEAINEHVTGDPWMTKPLRDQRLLECVSVIRRLLRGEEVDHVGLVEVDRARVGACQPSCPTWSVQPSAPPPPRVGSWADGLITVLQPTDDLKQGSRRVPWRWRRGKPAYLQVHLSWAESEADALRVAHEQWATNTFSGAVA